MTRDEIHAMIQAMVPVIEEVFVSGEKQNLRSRAEQLERDLVQARIADALEALAVSQSFAIPSSARVWPYLSNYAKRVTDRSEP